MSELISLSVAYNDATSEFFRTLSEMMEKDYPQITFVGHNENTRKGRTKSFKLKGGWSARMNPFALISIEDKPVKVFYTEAEECTVDNIKLYLDATITYLNNNDYESSSN